MEIPSNLKSVYKKLKTKLRENKRIVKKGLYTGIPLLLVISLYALSSQNFGFFQSSLSQKSKEIDLSAFNISVPTIKYGFAIDTFQVQQGEIPEGRFLAGILLEQKVSYPEIEQIVANSDSVFDIRHLRAGKNFTILAKDTAQGADYFIYEPNVYEYIVFHLKDDYKVERFEREITKVTSTASGLISTSLWNTMVDNGYSFELTDKMEDALQWSVDFHHLQKGDQFKLVYEQNFIEDKKVGAGQVFSAWYKNADHEYYAIYFDKTEHPGYYDLEGRPMRGFFLKAPVKYSRISSYYNLNRFHPILKRRRPHFGTDYAAPYGTPILAVGNGVVTRASYTGGNGNFVKIKHDKVHETQYLHMQKFAKGIAPGVHVKQGQVIGYVGSTGLATGPHVCFRFWKNGKQVNHLRMNFPPPEPLPEGDLPAFYVQRDHFLKMLKEIELPKPAPEEEETEVEKLGNP